MESSNTLRNLSEIAVTKTVIDTFKQAVNDLMIRNKGSVEIEDFVKLRQTRPFVAKDQEYTLPKKSVFNRIIGDSRFELQFSEFLERCGDVVSYAKNYLAVGFKLDYANVDGNIVNYYPDFVVKLADGRVVIVETKGREDPDTLSKMERLQQWCEDVNQAQDDTVYESVFVSDAEFEKYRPNDFNGLLTGFKK